jgi:hypothetical protein
MFIVGYYDGDDGYAGLNREMEGSLFEGEHYRTVGVGSCSFREYPHTLLKQVRICLWKDGYVLLLHLFYCVVEGFEGGCAVCAVDEDSSAECH